MKWKTAISRHDGDKTFVREKKLSSLVGKTTFSEATFLVLRGRKPNKKEGVLFDALLVSAIEHGIETPSAYVARTAVSTGNEMHTALAAGILSFGKWHGGAVEEAAKLFARPEDAATLVNMFLVRKEKLPGFGHKLYKEKDPRAQALLALGEKLLSRHKHTDKARGIENELEKQSGKKLPINIEGAMGACMLELGFDPLIGKALFAFARTPGLIAHIHEEALYEKPYRRLLSEDIEYRNENREHQ